jgi:glycosyltransferase involved in cell wall biosynthesis
VLLGWGNFLRGRGKPYEVLFVDDGSTDGSADLAEGLAGQVGPLKVLRHEAPRGPGAALRSGLAAATLPLVACAPCDPEYTPAALAQMMAEIDKVHLQTGFRAGRRVPWPWRLAGLPVRGLAWLAFGELPRRLPGWLGWRGHLAAWLARAFFGVRLRDVGCPMCLLRRDILARIPIQSDGAFAFTELIAKANFLGCLLAEEVPLPVRAPLGPATRPRRRRTLREAYRVFSRPDFGPPSLPQAPIIPAG